MTEQNILPPSRKGREEKKKECVQFYFNLTLAVFAP
jgi:hypothetical protein